MSAAAPAPLLAISGLHARFVGGDGETRAVDGVSLEVQAARRLGVVGESGSGKTQTFFGIFGLSAGSPGVVAGQARLGATELLDGLSRFVRPGGNDPAAPMVKDVAGWNRHHQRLLGPVLGRDVAMLFQDPKRSLIPYWTIAHHLRDVLVRRGVSKTDVAGQSQELLVALGFRTPGHILGAFPEQLSGGEAQRALLAVTMAMRPQLLVADEPTTGLDTINQARVLDALLQVQANASLALVLISHDLAVVDAMVDDVVVLFAGRVMERVTSEQLRRAGDDEIHPYTRQLRDSQRRRAAGAAISTEAFRVRLARASTGCPYHARCALKPRLSPTVQAQCTTTMPPERPLGPGHAAACWGLSS